MLKNSEKEYVRAVRRPVGAAIVASMLLGCGFPSHEFISDEVFYATGGRGKSTSGGSAVSSSGTANGSSSGTANGSSSGTANGSSSGTANGSSSGTASGSSSGTASGSSSGTASVAVSGWSGGGGDVYGGGAAGTGPATAAVGGQSGSSGTASDAGSAGRISENCQNGIDDDQDGFYDCEDSECSDWVCRTPVPTGWNGPVMVASAALESSLPSCASTVAYPLTDIARGCTQLNEAVAICPACPTCTNVVDPVANAEIELVSQCATKICATKLDTGCRMQLADGCNKVTFEKSALRDEYSTSRALGFMVYPPTFSGGNCQNASTSITPKSVGPDCKEWTRICSGAVAAGTCASGAGTCARKASGGLGNGHCIYKDGAVAECPRGWGNRPRLVHETFRDDRGCASCRCSPPEEPWPGEQIRVDDFSPDGNCQASVGGGGITVTQTPTCFNTFVGDYQSSGNIIANVRAAMTMGMPTPKCVAGGGNPTGIVAPVHTVTACCVEP